MSGSEIEFLEEYKDLICANTDDGQSKIMTPSTTPPDEDSSSLDQDIFERLFEDNSDEESDGATRKCFTKVSREDRSSLDSLDMLCKDLGEQIGVPTPSKTGSFGSTRLNSFTVERSAVSSSEVQKPTILEGVAAIKTKSVATVRPTLQHQQQRSLPKARLHSDNRVASLGRKLALEEPSTSRTPLNAPKRNLISSSTIRNSPVDQTKMLHRLNRPQPTIFKPEKHQSKDPAEDPLSLDNVAADLQCDMRSNSSLSELSDNESYVSLSDLDEDGRNIVDVPNDTRINYTRCDKFRASTPSPTVSEFIERHYQRKSGLAEDLSILSSTSSADSEHPESTQLCSKSLNMVKNWKMKNNVNAYVKRNGNRLSLKAVQIEKTKSGKTQDSDNVVSSTATDLNNRIMMEPVQKRSTHDKISSQKKNKRVYRQSGDNETIRHEHQINGNSENRNTSNTYINAHDLIMEEINETPKNCEKSNRKLCGKETSAEKVDGKINDHIEKADCPINVTETKKATAPIEIDLKFNNDVASPPITPMPSEIRTSKTLKLPVGVTICKAPATPKLSKDLKSTNEVAMSSEKHSPKPSARATICNTSSTAKRLHVSEVHNDIELDSKKRKEEISKGKGTKSNIGDVSDAEEASNNDVGFLENKNKYGHDVNHTNNSTTQKLKTVDDSKIQDKELNECENSQAPLENSAKCSVPKAVTFLGFKNKTTLKCSPLEKGNMKLEIVKTVGNLRKKKQFHKSEGVKEPSPKVRRIDDEQVDPSVSNNNQKVNEINQKDNNINCLKPNGDISLEPKSQSLDTLNTKSDQAASSIRENNNGDVTRAMPPTSNIVESTVNKGENISDDVFREKGNTVELSPRPSNDVKSHKKSASDSLPSNATKPETIALPTDNRGSSVNSINSKPSKRLTKSQNPKLIGSEECVKNKETSKKETLMKNVNEDSPRTHTESKPKSVNSLTLTAKPVNSLTLTAKPVNSLTLTECSSKQTTAEQKCSAAEKNSIASIGAAEPLLNENTEKQSSSNITVDSHESAQPPNNKASKSHDGSKSNNVTHSFPGESCGEHPKTRTNPKHKRSELDSLKDCMPSDMLQLVEKNQDNVRQLKKRSIVKTPCIMTASATTNIKESDMKKNLPSTPALDDKRPRLPKKSNRKTSNCSLAKAPSHAENTDHITLRKCRILLDEDFVPNYLKQLNDPTIIANPKESCKNKAGDLSEKSIDKHERNITRKTITTRDQRVDRIVPKSSAPIQSVPAVKKSTATDNTKQSSTTTKTSTEQLKEFRKSETPKTSSSNKCVGTKLQKSTMPNETISPVPSGDNASQKGPRDIKNKSSIELKSPRPSTDIPNSAATTLSEKEQQPMEECTQGNANSQPEVMLQSTENQDKTNDSNTLCSTTLNSELRIRLDDTELNNTNEGHAFSGSANPNHNENIVADRFATIIHGNEESVVEPKRELDIDEQNFNDLSATPSSTTLLSDLNSTPTNLARLNAFNLTPAIIDSSGTRLYSFLHPAKYTKNHCTVLLDYCCPNLDGPMAAIDPTRIHAQMQTLVRELPSYIVMKTELITRADLESNRGRIPASIRQKVEKITSVTAPTVVPTAPQQQNESLLPPKLAALQNRLPAATKITPRNANKVVDKVNLRLSSTRPNLLETESALTVSGNAVPSLRSVLAPNTVPPPANDVSQRNALRISLRRLDVLLRKLGQRIVNTSHLERGRCIESIVNDGILSVSPNDVDMAEKVLEVFTKRLKTQCDAVSNASTNNKTPQNGSGPVSRRISKSMATPAKLPTDPNLPKSTQVVRSGSVISTRRTICRSSARRNMPIYDSEQNIIGYQMQVVKAPPTAITMSSIGKTIAAAKTGATSASTISVTDQPFSQRIRLANCDADSSRSMMPQVDQRVGTLPGQQIRRIIKRTTRKAAPSTTTSTMTKIIVVAKKNANGQTAEPQLHPSAATDECILPDDTDQSTQIKEEQLEEDNS